MINHHEILLCWFGFFICFSYGKDTSYCLKEPKLFCPNLGTNTSNLLFSMNSLNRSKPKNAQSDICMLVQMSVPFLKWISVSTKTGTYFTALLPLTLFSAKISATLASRWQIDCFCCKSQVSNAIFPKSKLQFWVRPGLPRLLCKTGV